MPYRFLLTMMITSYLQRKYKKGETEKTDLGRHLIDFFDLYGKRFNYDDVAISIRKGGFYFRKDSRQGFTDFRGQVKLAVENPQDPSMDIGRGAFNIKRVQRAFQHAYDTLVFNNSNAVSLLKLIITASPDELKPGWRDHY